MKTIAEFRKEIKELYPHVRLKIRTVSFSDLARSEAKFMTIIGAQCQGEFASIKVLGKEAGISTRSICIHGWVLYTGCPFCEKAQKQGNIIKVAMERHKFEQGQSEKDFDTTKQVCKLVSKYFKTDDFPVGFILELNNIISKKEAAK